MKIAPLIAVLSLGSLLGACDSLDNPLDSPLLHAALNTGNDARVLNTNTGSYEWPATTPTPKPKPANIAAANKTTPTPAKSAVPQKGSVAKAKNATPTPPNAAIVAVAKATPIPVPNKGTGTFNFDTGKVDWWPSGVSASGKPADALGQATPAPSATGAGTLFPQ